MKKKIIVTLVLAILLLLPIKAKAITGTVGLDCAKKNLSPNETTTCSLTFNTQGSFNAVKTLLTAEEGITIESVTAASGWQGEGEANLQLYIDNDKTGNVAIATITIKAGTITGVTKKLKATEISITDQQYQETSFDNKEESIRIQSNVNTLGSLVIAENEDDYYANDKENNKLAIDFKPDVQDYRINGSAELKTVFVFASLTSNRSEFVEKYEPRKIDLAPGENKIEIKVRAENGSVKTYTVTIVKPRVNSGNVTNSYGEKVKVEDTSKVLSKIVYVVSGLLLTCGVGFIVYSLIKKKKANPNDNNNNNL